MRNEDLMVGDWFRFRYTIDGKEIVLTFRISQTADDLGYVWGNDGNRNGRMCKTEQLEPIPITPEILEKNGFKYIGDDSWQLEEHPYYFWIDFAAHQYGCEYALSFDHDEHRLKLYGIPNVHELQHALKLCGIDKEVVL